jgi:hypothetical protein
MLSISLAAILFACILLILELSSFGWDIKGTGARAELAPVSAPAYAVADITMMSSIV